MSLIGKIEEILEDCNLDSTFKSGMGFVSFFFVPSEKGDEVVEVMNLFDIGGYKIFESALNGRENTSKHFEKYIETGDIPWRVRQYCRNVLKDYQP